MGSHFINLQQAIKILNQDIHINNAVMITFDEVHKNTIDIALPILNAMKVPALLNTCLNNVGPLKHTEPFLSNQFETKDNICQYGSDEHKWLIRL